ncbi:MAG: hypothetical protein AAGH46_01235 [Bacteroidota bacterium]
MSTAKFKVAQKVGTYTDKDNNEKGRYLEVGVVIEHKDGNQTMKLNCYPLPNEKGEIWLNLFPIKSENSDEKRS